jgi:hypothetical protein
MSISGSFHGRSKSQRPEGDHLFEIFLAKNAYFHGIGYLFRTLKSDYGANG